MKRKRVVLNPVAITAVGLVVLIGGCTHSYRLRVMDKENVEHRPCDYLGYYSTSWMPVESFGAVGWCGCQQPTCRSAGSCSCVSADVPPAEMDVTVFDPPQVTDAAEPLAPQWLHAPVDPTVSSDPPQSQQDTVNGTAFVMPQPLARLTRLPKPQPKIAAEADAVLASRIAPVEPVGPHKGPNAYFVGGRYWQQRDDMVSEMPAAAHSSAEQSTGVQWR